MRVSFINLFLLTLLSLCAPSQLPAQTTTTGALAGVITDPGAAAVVPDATIQIEDQARGINSYHAPSTSGTFHVVAQWSTAFNPVIIKNGMAVITVQ